MIIIMIFVLLLVLYFLCVLYVVDIDIEFFYYFEVVIKVSKKFLIYIFYQLINYQIKWYDFMRKYILFFFDVIEQVQDSW